MANALYPVLLISGLANGGKKIVFILKISFNAILANNKTKD